MSLVNAAAVVSGAPAPHSEAGARMASNVAKRDRRDGGKRMKETKRGPQCSGGEYPIERAGAVAELVDLHAHVSQQGTVEIVHRRPGLAFPHGEMAARRERPTRPAGDQHRQVE